MSGPLRVIITGLLACIASACSDSQSMSSTDNVDAASGAKQDLPPAAKAGSGGQTTARSEAGSPAAMSGSSGRQSASAGSAAAGMRAAAAGSSDSGGTAGSAGATGSTGGAGASADAGVPAAGGPAAAECGLCAQYAEPAQAGTIKASGLTALSGLAASRSQPDIYFAHNDHDRPVVYALDLEGQQHARITLEDADSQDIEDIAVGKCDTKTCVYLADVGDNAAQRDEYGILRFVEPVVPSTPGDEAQTPMFEALRFRYEDGSHNAESLMVAPNGSLYIVTKLAPGSGGSVDASGPSAVYRIEASAFAQGGVAQATRVTTLSVPQSGEPALSAAAAHPCGLGFLARTYDRVYEFLAPPGAADFEAAFTAMPEIVAQPDEPQSEGIDYRADGRGFVTSGEGMSAPLMLTQCVR